MSGGGVTMAAMATWEERVARRKSLRAQSLALVSRPGRPPQMDRESGDEDGPEPAVAAGKLGQGRDAARADRPGLIDAEAERNPLH
jgi:hypothetical protein